MNNNTNTVELLGWYGDDKTIACSAWTSTSRDLSEEKIQRIPKLLEKLAKEGHHTPFEKSSLHFLVNCDIASHIQILKHRISVSVNAESARYKELKEDKFYVPEDWQGITCSNDEPIALLGENFDRLFGERWDLILSDYTELGNKLYHAALKDLEPVLGRKRAKESARYFKTYNSQIQCDIMFNWRSFHHFQSLRNEDNSQREIQKIAQKMLDLVKNIDGNPFKYTLEAFNYV